ncbi:MAG: hypothetical protein QM286_09545 [Acidobacteriota bacterium]|nr:hypothetical protein [Acidobacteriota bacterium]
MISVDWLNLILLDLIVLRSILLGRILLVHLAPRMSRIGAPQL